MRGWNKGGERVDLTSSQQAEVRQYMDWIENGAPHSLFMFSEEANNDPDRVFITTVDKIDKAGVVYSKMKKLWELGFDNMTEAIEIHLEAQKWR